MWLLISWQVWGGQITQGITYIKKKKFPQEGWEEVSVLEEQDGHAEALYVNVKAEFSLFSLTSIAWGKYPEIAEDRVNRLDC